MTSDNTSEQTARIAAVVAAARRVVDEAVLLAKSDGPMSHTDTPCPLDPDSGFCECGNRPRCDAIGLLRDALDAAALDSH